MSKRRDNRPPRPELVRCVFAPCSRTVLYRVQTLTSAGVGEEQFTCDLHPMRIVREADETRFVITRFREDRR